MNAAERIAALILGRELSPDAPNVPAVTMDDFAKAAFLALDARGFQVAEMWDGVRVATYGATGERQLLDLGTVTFLRP